MNQLATMWKLAGPARIPVVFGAVLRLAQSLCLGVAFGAAMSVVIHIVHDTTPSPREVVWIAALCGIFDCAAVLWVGGCSAVVAGGVSSSGAYAFTTLGTFARNPRQFLG